ncbi:MAG: methionine gamma-lyase family protein [Vampirovibrionales bacterium]
MGGTGGRSLTAPAWAWRGSTFNQTRTLLQGLYVAPTTVKEALKSMSLMATVFDGLGYPVYPKPAGPFHDIIQVIELGHPRPYWLSARPCSNAALLVRA